MLYKLQGRYAEAEPLYKRDHASNEKALGGDHPVVASSLNNLARYAEAEPLCKRALAKREQALGLEHPAVAASLNSLAGLYYAENRYAEVEPLLRRSLAIREKLLGPDHPEVGNALNNLAGFYSTVGRYAEAPPLAKRALALTERAAGPDHPTVGTPLSNLALLYAALGRYAEAEPLAKRSLAVREKALGADHPDVGTPLNTLAGLSKGQGRYAEAEAFYKRSISVFETALGPDHPDVTNSLNNLAGLFFEQQNWPMAANTWQRSTDLIVRRTKRGTDVVGKPLTGKASSEAGQDRLQFSSLVSANYRMAAVDQTNAPELARAMFQTAQWAQGSEAAASLTQMSARQAKGDTSLAELVRERQDLVGEWQGRDKLLVSLISKRQAERSVAAEQEQRERLAAIDARLTVIDKSLQDAFPEYAALAYPQPMNIADTQRQLRDDEALVLFLDAGERKSTTEETYQWVVTKTDVQWVRIEPGTKTLSARVAALRCGLCQCMGRQSMFRSAQGGEHACRPPGWQAATVRSWPGARSLSGVVRTSRGPDQG